MPKEMVYEMNDRIEEKAPVAREMYKLSGGYAEVLGKAGEQPTIRILPSSNMVTVDPKTFIEIAMEFIGKYKARYPNFGEKFDNIIEALKEVKI